MLLMCHSYPLRAPSCQAVVDISSSWQSPVWSTSLLFSENFPGHHRCISWPCTGTTQKHRRVGKAILTPQRGRRVEHRVLVSGVCSQGPSEDPQGGSASVSHRDNVLIRVLPFSQFVMFPFFNLCFLESPKFLSQGVLLRESTLTWHPCCLWVT